MRLRRAGAGIKPCRACSSVRPENRGERFPVDWQDPLDLYGSLRGELAHLLLDPAVERMQAREWVRLHGAQWVWCHRRRLVSLRKLVVRAQSAACRQKPAGGRGEGERHGSPL